MPSRIMDHRPSIPEQSHHEIQCITFHKDSLEIDLHFLHFVDDRLVSCIQPAVWA